jgi:hypothetical protein
MDALKTTLDEATARKLTELGASQDDVTTRPIFYDLAGNVFLKSRNPCLSFHCLEMLDWQSSFDFIKGLVKAENHGISNYCGSVSLVKYAYRVVDRRDRVLAMEIAAWIVDNSSNDYIPFAMRKVRYAFDEIRKAIGSWADCRARLDIWEAGEWQRQNSAANAELDQLAMAEERDRILKTVKARCHAERQQMSAAHASIRSQFLEEIAKLDVKARLEHLAWDDSRDLSFYPASIGDLEAEAVLALDSETQSRLVTKLQNRPKGPWRNLLKRIEMSISESAFQTNEEHRSSL